jgi:predicted Zn-dependent protease
LKKAAAAQPYRAVLHFQLAVIYQQRQELPEAIRELETGLQYAPDDPMAQRMLDQLRRR